MRGKGQEGQGAHGRPPDAFGEYRLLKRIGRGGIGETFAATAHSGPCAGQTVCLKVLLGKYQAPGDDDVARRTAIASLRREARVVGTMDHPNIARALHVGEVDGVWFVAFELVDGVHLGRVLRQCPEGIGMRPSMVAAVGLEVAKALAYAHARDVLHRDVKPTNILVSRQGEVKLVDFGLAKVRAKAAQHYTRHVGTPRYWAPEQARGAALSPQTDIYALGIVLLELLARKHPFPWDSPEDFPQSVLDNERLLELPSLSIPEGLRHLIETCIRPDPRDRFPSTEALVAALSAEVDDDPRADLRALVGQAIAHSVDIPLSAFGLDEDSGPSSWASSVGESREPSTMKTRPRVLAKQALDAMLQTDSARGAVDDLGRIARASDGPSSGRTPANVSSDVGDEGASRAPVRTSGSPRVRRWAALTGLIAAAGGVLVLVQQSGGSSAETSLRTRIDIAADNSPVPQAAVDSLSETSAAPLQLRAKPNSEEHGPLPSLPDATGTPNNQSAPRADGPMEGRRKPASPRPNRPAPAVSRTKRVEVTIGLIPGGRVLVDGRDVGESPVKVKLTKGWHRIAGRLNKLRASRQVAVTERTKPIVLDLRHANSHP